MCMDREGIGGCALPNYRSCSAELLYCIFMAVMLFVAGGIVFCNEGVKEAVIYSFAAIATPLPLLLMLELVRRTCLFAEEYKHIPVRYPDCKTAIYYAFSFNKKTICCVVLSLIFTLIFWFKENPYIYLWEKGPTACIIPFLVAFIISNLIGMEESILQTSLSIEKMQSLDYGSGMAYNFFYGYLRLVLPVSEDGSESKDIRRRIETYCNKHSLDIRSFPIKKLFILIPQNLYTPTNLVDVSKDSPEDLENWMDAAVDPLEARLLDRAGVLKRVYKNTVYKIRDPDKINNGWVYIVAEGATPLKTLYDVINMNPKMSGIFKKHRHEIVAAFCRTLQQIIRERDDCRDLCEIIYYNDTDTNNRPVNVARIILQRIQDLSTTARQLHHDS